MLPDESVGRDRATLGDHRMEEGLTRRQVLASIVRTQRYSPLVSPDVAAPIACDIRIDATEPSRVTGGGGEDLDRVSVQRAPFSTRGVVQCVSQ